MTKSQLGNYCEIVNLDLSGKIPGVIPSCGRRGVYLVYWWHDIPLGQDYIDCGDVALSKNEIIRAALGSITSTTESYRSQYGCRSSSMPQVPSSGCRQDYPATLKKIQESLRQTFNQTNASTPVHRRTEEETVSIVIPTHNRPEKLSVCLKSLQTLRQPPHEIVVVDNAPHKPETRQVIDNFSSVRYITEKRTGASIARNTGVRQSNGSIIAFVDDDETVHPKWLSWLTHCFENQRTGIATGLVLPAELRSEAQFIFERRFSFIRGFVPTLFDNKYYQKHKNWGVAVWNFGGSGNMAIRRTVFDQLGGFDERLGAGRAGCSEDSELFYNAMVHGWQCQYEPRAVIYHFHRPDIDSVKTQLFFYMRGHVTALLTQYSKYKDIGNLFRLFVVLPMVYLKNLIRGLAGGPTFQLHFLWNEIFGCFSGVQFYMRHRRKT